MSDIEKLTLLWEDGSIDSDQLIKFKFLLKEPKNKEYFVNHFTESTFISEIMKGKLSNVNEIKPIGSVTRRIKQINEISKNRESVINKKSPLFVYLSIAALLLLSLGSYYYFSRSHIISTKPTNSIVVDNTEMGVIEHCDSSVRIKRNGLLIPLKPGDKLKWGDEIFTAEEHLKFKLANDSISMGLSKNSNMVIDKKNNVIKSNLKSGYMESVVEKVAGQTLEVETNNSIATVLGTDFAFFKKKEYNKLVVFDGVVNFKNKSTGKSINVNANQYCIGRDNYELTPIKFFINNGGNLLFDNIVEGYDAKRLLYFDNCEEFKESYNSIISEYVKEGGIHNSSGILLKGMDKTVYFPIDYEVTAKNIRICVEYNEVNRTPSESLFCIFIEDKKNPGQVVPANFMLRGLKKRIDHFIMCYDLVDNQCFYYWNKPKNKKMLRSEKDRFYVGIKNYDIIIDNIYIVELEEKNK